MSNWTFPGDKPAAKVLAGTVRRPPYRLRPAREHGVQLAAEATLPDTGAESRLPACGDEGPRRGGGESSLDGRRAERRPLAAPPLPRRVGGVDRRGGVRRRRGVETLPRLERRAGSTAVREMRPSIAR